MKNKNYRGTAPLKTWVSTGPIRPVSILTTLILTVIVTGPIVANFVIKVL